MAKRAFELAVPLPPFLERLLLSFLRFLIGLARLVHNPGDLSPVLVVVKVVESGEVDAVGAGDVQAPRAGLVTDNLTTKK